MKKNLELNKIEIIVKPRNNDSNDATMQFTQTELSMPGYLEINLESCVTLAEKINEGGEGGFVV